MLQNGATGYRTQSLVQIYLTPWWILCSRSSAVDLCSLHKQNPTNACSNPGWVELFTRYLKALSKLLWAAIKLLTLIQRWIWYRQTYSEWRGKWMVKATKHKLDNVQSRSDLASHWNLDIELECVIAVRASVFALKDVGYTDKFYGGKFKYISVYLKK